MDNLLNGRKVAARFRSNLQQKITKLAELGLVPGLDVILVGHDPASEIYVRNKEQACQRVGIRSNVHRLPPTVSQMELHARIQQLNHDAEVHGILLQLPLPGSLNANEAVEQIEPDKDVDGLHPVNLGRLMAGVPGLVPCTPMACMALLDELGDDLVGKKAVVVGRSILVGKPLALLLLQQHATVTLCHSRTQNLAEEVASADILVAATGRPELIRGSWIKKGAVVLDVGTNTQEDGSLVGDVEFAQAVRVARAITPVPGGVGPMTIAMLMHNTITAVQLYLAKQKRQEV